MERPGLEVEIAGLRFPNPLILASGIADETGASMAEAVKRGAGGVVTKSLSLIARDGHQNPCVVELPFGLLNAMGLPNPGIEAYREEVDEYLRSTKSSNPIIGSVFGSNIEEYGLAAKGAQDIGVNAVEINGSCPNAHGLGLEFGQDPMVIYELVKEVKRRVTIPVFFKLTPATSNIVKLGQAAEKAGADGIVAVNTMPAMKIDVHTGRPILTNVTGGLSGPALRPVGVRCVYQLASSGNITIPIIGVGGITNWQDAVEYIMAGASAVQIGTGITWEDLDIFSKIAQGIRSFLEAEGYSSIDGIKGKALEVRK
jgi:dihydroorotate dehydrogenase (NAD+) catalytic subunit